MSRFRTSHLVSAIGLLVGFGAAAAELPSRNSKSPSAQKMQTCDIDGQPGLKLPGGETCLRISGYVSAGVAAGKLH